MGQGRQGGSGESGWVRGKDKTGTRQGQDIERIGIIQELDRNKTGRRGGQEGDKIGA